MLVDILASSVSVLEVSTMAMYAAEDCQACNRPICAERIRPYFARKTTHLSATAIFVTCFCTEKCVLLSDEGDVILRTI